MGEEPGKAMQRWADAQQYHQEPMPEEARKGPTVRILNATPDPLGTLAAITTLYKGRVVRSLSEITDDERRKAFADMQATALNSALESVNFVILFEGVDRAFTHQHVRGRNAMYVQESLRFAVPEDWAGGIPLPPSLAAEPDSAQARIWQRTLNSIEDAYAALVNNGVPAEEARGLLPNAIQTRIHWVVSLRELLHVAGLRTCTQAQFIWRIVFAEVARALREWSTVDEDYAVGADRWQFKFLANAIRPVCYQTGSCAFKASFDRTCNIRERVDANERAGRPSSEWGEWGPPGYLGVTALPPIHDREWAATPGAARTQEA